VLHPARHDQELARLQLDGFLAPDLDPEAAAHHQEELVLVRVMVPDELALELRELHFLPVELADEPGPPVLADRRELGGEIDLLDHFFFRLER
jgi:hypothetical protein